MTPAGSEPGRAGERGVEVTAPQDEDTRAGGASRAGDDPALAELYARWSPLVYSLALRALDDVERAEQVTRRVFTRAWQLGEDTGPEPGRFADRLVDLTRAEITGLSAGDGVPTSPRSRTPGEERSPSESKTGVLAERLVVADGMSQLDTLSRRVLQMALDHDLTLDEIAERTGLRADEVRSTITSSLSDLRHRLEGRADAHRR